MDISFTPAEEASSKSVMIFAGGSGDDKNSFSEIIQNLRTRMPEYGFCTFNYSNESSGTQLTNDLTQVMEHLLQTGAEKITIFSTSLGAYPACHIAANPYFERNLEKLIFFDPADYEINQDGRIIDTWSGSQTYHSTGNTASGLLEQIKGNTIVDVVHLTLRNWGENEYLEKDFKKRWKDEVSGHPRLSTDMVRSFFDNVPEKNRGKYLENKIIPHAFTRDGNISENCKNVSWIILILAGQAREKRNISPRED